MTPTERYRRIAEIMDEAYTAYENGVVALRKQIVEDMRRRVKEGGVLDRPLEGSPSRSDSARLHRPRRGHRGRG